MRGSGGWGWRLDLGTGGEGSADGAWGQWSGVGCGCGGAGRRGLLAWCDIPLCVYASAGVGSGVEWVWLGCEKRRFWVLGWWVGEDGCAGLTREGLGWLLRLDASSCADY